MKKKLEGALDALGFRGVITKRVIPYQINQIPEKLKPHHLRKF